MINASKETKLTRHSNSVAAGTTKITPSSGIDTQGFDGCMFVVSLGAITATAVTSIEVHTSSDDGAADAYTALAGTKVTIADTDDQKMFYLDIVEPRERYLKLIVNRGTANAVLDGIVAVQYRAKAVPTTHDSTVGGGELHLSPAEGTA